jgi:hypothetical protein
MSIMSWVGLGSEMAKPIKAVGDLYTTDKARIAADTELETAQQRRGLAQLENNRVMALASNLFTSGWQPMVAWSAGFCVALYYIPQLIIANIIWSNECFELGHVVPFPIDPTDILNLVYLLFGFGTYNIVKRKLIG